MFQLNLFCVLHHGHKMAPLGEIRNPFGELLLFHCANV